MRHRADPSFSTPAYDHSNSAEPIKICTRYQLEQLMSKKAGMRVTRTWRLTVRVFLPFAAGYYLSYLFRTINALIVGHLSSDAGLGSANVGLLTSVYFLVFAAAQIP